MDRELERRDRDLDFLRTELERANSENRTLKANHISPDIQLQKDRNGYRNRVREIDGLRELEHRIREL